MSLISVFFRRQMTLWALLAVVAGVCLMWPGAALVQGFASDSGTMRERLLSPGPAEAMSRIAGGALAGLLGLVLPNLVGRRRRVESELAASQARYRVLVENVEDGVATLCPDGTIEYASPAAAKLLGLTPEEVTGRHFNLFIHPGDRETAEQAFARVLGGAAELIELRLVAASGRICQVRASSRLLVRDGAPAAILTVVTDLTGHRETEQRLRMLLRAIEASSSIVVITDTSGCITYVNPTFSEVTGYSADEVLGRSTRILKSGEMPPEIYQKVWETISRGGEWRGEFHNRRKDGSSYWEQAAISPVLDDAGEITHYVAVKEDITARKLAEQMLIESEEKYRLLFSRQLDAAALIDSAEGRIVEANVAFGRLFGWSASELSAMRAEEIWAAGAPPVIPAEGITIPETWCRRQDGSIFAAELSAGMFTWRGRLLTCLILRDVTERVENQRRLEELSATDGLTGLANWRTFHAHMHAEWRRAVRARSPLALVMADIDHFKVYNDTLGHLAGDACLRRVASAMLGVARRTADLIARWGGEEFALLLPGTPEQGAVAVAEAMRSAVEELGIPHPSSSVGPVVTLSLGLAVVVPEEGMSPDDLVAAADGALFAAKREGRNRVRRAPSIPVQDVVERSA